MNDEILDVNLEKPIYKKSHIQLATFFGGPLAIVYILSENFKQLGYPEKVKKTWIFGIAFCILFFAAVFIINSSGKSPNFLIPLISILIGTAIIQSWQGEDIKHHIEQGGPVYSIWRALLIGIICLVITMVFLIILLLILFNVFGFPLRNYSSLRK
jgi:hypothetical protein